VTKLKLDDSKEVEIEATVYTAEVYEQNFKRDLISDLIPAENGTIPFINCIRALWAMMKTADYRAGRPTPTYEQWVADTGSVNYHELMGAVAEEATGGFFRPRADSAED
jgi:hypothetical protein